MQRRKFLDGKYQIFCRNWLSLRKEVVGANKISTYSMRFFPFTKTWNYWWWGRCLQFPYANVAIFWPNNYGLSSCKWTPPKSSTFWVAAYERFDCNCFLPITVCKSSNLRLIHLSLGHCPPPPPLLIMISHRATPNKDDAPHTKLTILLSKVRLAFILEPQVTQA